MKRIAFLSWLCFLYIIGVSAQTDTYMTKAWGNIDYTGNQWVCNQSRPNKITKGLQNRHVALWASHGRYYDLKTQVWKWQRPSLFCTTEDLFTQTIVVPYLIPMLELAGANVFTPRERDWQPNEVIVDNDNNHHSAHYFETNNGKDWITAPSPGFSQHPGTYLDGENPFMAGSARFAKTTKSKHFSTVAYQPAIPQSGKYAVYVSYQTLENSVDDAQYTVYHKGQATHFTVNQQMGGGTWVYLGTFDFDKGCNPYNRVVVSNQSHSKGVVSTDAVRFGGGTGNIERGGSTSGLPRCLEGARYAAQWAGAPYAVYSSKSGVDDYADDINVRSLMTNWLAGGSVYAPDSQGLKVPIELSLAIHSDAGIAKDFQSLIGSLAICTTNFNNGLLQAGISRFASKDFAGLLLNNVTADMQQKYGRWVRRELWDRNYSETRLPAVPSAILETMSHQNFPDMRLGQDPNFKFFFARSIYKSIVQYISDQHGTDYVVSPLPPKYFRIEIKGHNKLQLSWLPVQDPASPNTNATSYNVYMSSGTSGFDNGTNVKEPVYTLKAEPGVQYNFYITACNAGGESFPTEVLSAYCTPKAKATVLVVNAFSRLSSPEVIDTDSLQGFDMHKDFGVSYGKTLGWNGRQLVFEKSKAGIETPEGLGYGGEELAGKVIMGNTFDYARTHVDAIASARCYNIVSCSQEALLAKMVDLHKYKCADILFGLEKNDAHSLQYYKTFTPAMQQLLNDYTRRGGSLIVSGAFIGSDMQTEAEQSFLQNTLKVRYTPTDSCTNNGTVKGMGLAFNIYNTLNSEHYAALSTDILHPFGKGICALQYADLTCAGVAYKGRDYRSFAMGFPFECIIDRTMRHQVMRGILHYIMK